MPKFELEETVKFSIDLSGEKKKGYVIDHKVDNLLGDVYAIKTKFDTYIVPEKHIQKLNPNNDS